MKTTLLCRLHAGVHPAATCSAISFTLLLASLFVASGQTLSNLWYIAPGTPGYDLDITNRQQRGLAYNPATGNLIYGNRSGAAAGIKVKRVEGGTGTLLADMDTNPSVLTGGAAYLGAVVASEDGVVYAGNISGSLSAAPAFRLYRWASETSAVELVYLGDLDGTIARVGDALAIRGTGTNTQILVGGDTNTVALLTTVAEDGTNGSWSARKLTVTNLAGVTGNPLKAAVAFGEGNTFFAKNLSRTLYRIEYDLNSGTAGTVFTYPLTVVGGLVAGLAYDPTNKLLLGTTRNSAANSYQTNLLYDLYLPNSPGLVASRVFPTNVSDGAAGVSWAALGGGKAFAMVQNNGLVAYTLNIVPTPPQIAANPVNTTIVQGGYGSLTAGASGSQPLSFQWQFNDTNLPNATNLLLLLTNVTPEMAGSYRLVVTNIYGSNISANATLTVAPAALSGVATVLWRLAPGDRPYLTTDDTQRGLAYNPTTGNLLLLSRTPTNAIHVLNGDTGEYLRTLKMDPIITGGTFALNLVACTDDGGVLAGNLTLNGTTTQYKLYYWLDDGADTVPVVAWQGDPGNGDAHRWGDTLAVRGIGMDAQVLLASRASNAVSYFIPSFGPPATRLIFDAPAGAAGLGIDFGSGNTFWTKSASHGLRHLSYNTDNGTATTLHHFTNVPPMTAIGVDAEANLLAGVSLETPDNLRLFDISNLAAGLLEVDTEFFLTDNLNINGTGAVTFGPGRLYALDSNNGIMALALNTNLVPPRLTYARVGSDLTLNWTGAATLQVKPSVTGTWSDVAGATSGFTTNLAGGGELFFRLRK